jgi:hypothetical protein
MLALGRCPTATVGFVAHAEEPPEVGERRASTHYGLSTALPVEGEPPADAVWLVEEWDGAKWRRVGEARGDSGRDQMLHKR